MLKKFKIKYIKWLGYRKPYLISDPIANFVHKSMFSLYSHEAYYDEE